MIRFACPGCSATFTVEDEKAGKTGKCPKCQSQFVIPDVPNTGSDVPASADLAPLSPAPPPLPVSPPPPPIPSAGSSDPVEIQPCPKCQSRLSVLPADIGLDIECPNCQRVYQAIRADAPPPPKRGDRGEPRGDLVRLGSGSDKTDDDRPPQRRSRYRDDEDDRPSRRRQDEDDSEDDPDRRYRRRSRRYADDYERRLIPHRGIMILVFGIVGYISCIPIFGILAWVMGSQDIRAMDEGRMDPEGRGLTRAGQILGMILCLLSIVGIVFYCGLIGLAGFR